MWNKCRNNFSECEFNKQWNNLLIKYPTARKYLERALGIDITSWALCYTHWSFNGGIQSTQRVESYNSKEQANQNLTVGLPNIIDRYFSRINITLKHYLIPQEAAITIISKKHLSDNCKPIYEYQIDTNYSLLNEIRHTQIFSETIKQNLSRQVKYNQGFGYAKRAVNLALETGHENELNELLLGWIK
ncbi:18673_t:CDS:2 [Gigaspora rosea]|nr:18673_t:CDS:2 [Gigaspora rosea]